MIQATIQIWQNGKLLDTFTETGESAEQLKAKFKDVYQHIDCAVLVTDVRAA